MTINRVVGPLNWAIPIVDAQGRPTVEFQTKWREQNRVNGEIPDTSDAAAVSALLDKIGGTQGALLRRGSEQWQLLETPGGVTQFLRADGSYAAPPQQTVTEAEINLSDVLTNNVSASRHGFTPKLPNDAAQYLDGTGQWSTPAGGGGGAGTSYLNPGGRGDRTSIITVTSSWGPGGGTNSNLVDGAYPNGSTDSAWYPTSSAAGLWLQFDFGEARLVNEATWFQSNTTAQGVWKWQRSPDASAWTDIAREFSLGGTQVQAHPALHENDTAARYYRLLGVSGGWSNSPWINEILFKIDAGS